MIAPFEKFDLSGRRALVTGGAAGLGFHMARALGRAGADLVLVARRGDVLEQAAATLKQDPLIRDVRWIPADLYDRNAVAALSEKTGAIDILIGNAAINRLEQIADVGLQSVDDLFQLNFTANLQLAQAFLPGMRERGWGRVIFISSITSLGAMPRQGSTVYAASKAAVNSLARSIAADMGRYGITANALVLGPYMTDMLERGQREREKQNPEAARQFFADLLALSARGQIGDPLEVEGVIQLLASDAGANITGVSLPIDGGMSIMMRPLPLD